jgi:hypothetical protein
MNAKGKGINQGRVRGEAESVQRGAGRCGRVLFIWVDTDIWDDTSLNGDGCLRCRAATSAAQLDGLIQAHPRGHCFTVDEVSKAQALAVLGAAQEVSNG